MYFDSSYDTTYENTQRCILMYRMILLIQVESCIIKRELRLCQKIKMPFTATLVAKAFDVETTVPSANRQEGSSSVFSEMFCSFGSSRSNAFISGYETEVFEKLLLLALLSLDAAFCIDFLQPI